MGQLEVLQVLKDFRKKSDAWVTCRMVQDELLKQGHSKNYCQHVYNDLFKLATFGLIQCQGVGWWKHQKEFRAKKK